MRLDGAASPLAVALWAAVLLLLVGGCKHEAEVVLHGTGGPVRVRVEVVNTPVGRQQGLMYRRELPPDTGMLFVFPADGVQHFWMRNTLIPLDMVFIDRDRRVVGIVANAVPMSTQPVGPDKPCLYVLEVNGGFTARHGVTEGATVELIDVPAGAT